MGKNATRNTQPETAEQAYSRVLKRKWKNIIGASVIVAASAGGVMWGANEVLSTDAPVNQNGQNRAMLGLLAIFASVSAGGVGGIIALKKLDRDQRSLEHKEAQLDRQADLSDALMKSGQSGYKFDKATGQYQTYGETLTRVSTRRSMRQIGTAVGGMAGTLSIIDALSRYPTLTDVFYKVTHEYGAAKMASSLTEFYTGAALLSAGVACAIGAYKDGRKIVAIADNVRHFGADARPRVKAKDASPE